MKCIICGECITDKAVRHDTIITKGNSKKGEESNYRRSIKLYPMCHKCHHAGDYKSLASKVIYSAIDEFCFPRMGNKRLVNNVMAYQSGARWFLFGGEDLKMWAGLANFPPENIRAYVRGILEDIKSGNGQARQEEVEKCLI